MLCNQNRESIMGEMYLMVHIKGFTFKTKIAQKIEKPSI